MFNTMTVTLPSISLVLRLISNVTGTGKRHHPQALQYNSFLNAHG